MDSKISESMAKFAAFTLGILLVRVAWAVFDWRRGRGKDEF